MLEISDNLWVDVDPIGRVLIGHEDRVVRIEIEEREQVIRFLQTADDYLDVQVTNAEAQREELMLNERVLSQNNG